MRCEGACLAGAQGIHALLQHFDKLCMAGQRRAVNLHRRAAGKRSLLSSRHHAQHALFGQAPVNVIDRHQRRILLCILLCRERRHCTNKVGFAPCMKLTTFPFYKDS